MGAIYSGRSNTTQRSEWDFRGGINTALSPFDIDENESTDEYGWDSDKFPVKKTAKGILPLGASGSQRISLLCAYLDSKLLRVYGQTLQEWGGTSWNTISSTMYINEYYDYTHFNDKLFIVNGTDRFVYNGATLATFATAGQTGSKVICSDNSRIFLAERDVVHYCAFQDENDWTSGNNSGFFQYYTPTGGDITAMTEFYGDKLIFKKNSMAILHGVDYFNYQLQEVSNDTGCVNHKTLQEVGDTLIWLGEQAVYAFMGGKPFRISDKIKHYLDRLSPFQSHQCTAFTDGIKYYLTLPLDGQSAPSIRLVYDTRYGTWEVSHLNEKIVYGCRYRGELYAGTETGEVYKINAGPSSGAWSVTTKVFDEGKAEVLKEYKELHLQGHFAPGFTMKVEFSRSDRGDDWIEIPYTFTSSNVVQNKNLIIPLDAIQLTNWVRFRLSGTGSVELQQMQRYFRVFRR